MYKQKYVQVCPTRDLRCCSTGRLHSMLQQYIVADGLRANTGLVPVGGDTSAKIRRQCACLPKQSQIEQARMLRGCGREGAQGWPKTAMSLSLGPGQVFSGASGACRRHG